MNHLDIIPITYNHIKKLYIIVCDINIQFILNIYKIYQYNIIYFDKYFHLILIFIFILLF